MKKIFLCACLLCTVFFTVAPTKAATNSMSDAIFKIQAYSYNKLSDMYTLEQYGSAVLIADNILLTNAHVITDMSNNLTLQYEACQTISEQEAPKCFSTLQLLRYDKDTDLALLQIVSPTSDMPDPIVMWSGTLSVGAAVRIIWYPANGGDTITTTQGTIAGFEDEYYKTDANVDEGNSWWWTFDNAGNFVGIPTYVINGQTTLWYIITIDAIKDFIAGKFGTTYKTKYSTVFDKWLKSMYVIKERWTIDNNLFTTPSFSGLGLTLNYAIEKKSNNLYSYSLYNENDSSIDMVSLIATDNATITRYISNVMKQLADNDYAPKKTTKKIWTTTRTVISFGTDDRVGYDYIKTTSTNKTYLEFVVYADKEETQDIADLIKFVESTTIKKSSGTPQAFNLPSVKLSSTWNIGIMKYMQNGSLSLNIFPTNSKYVSEIYQSIGEKWDTLKTIARQAKDLYENMWMTVTSETSKYPSSVSIISMIDENDKTTLSMIGVKKYGTSNLFINITTNLISASAKQEVITLGYKILGLE